MNICHETMTVRVSHRQHRRLKRERQLYIRLSPIDYSKALIAQESDMNSNLIIFVVIIGLLCFSSTNGSNTFTSNNNIFDASQQGFYNENVTYVMAKRNLHRKCVSCKFGFFPCCEPDICVKKSFRPDKCLSIKVGK